MSDDNCTGSAGLQAERTRLAWTRTGLSVTALCALLVLHASTRATPVMRIVLLSYSGVALAGVIAMLAPRLRQLRNSPPPSLPFETAILVAALAAGAALIALMLAFA